MHRTARGRWIVVVAAVVLLSTGCDDVMLDANQDATVPESTAERAPAAPQEDEAQAEPAPDAAAPGEGGDDAPHAEQAPGTDAETDADAAARGGDATRGEDDGDASDSDADDGDGADEAADEGGETVAAPDRPDGAAAGPLSWRPPNLSEPQTRKLTTNPGVVRLEANRDYVLEMPASPVRSPMTIRGGRNVVLIGGEISIPWAGSSPTINDRRALLIADQTGTVHVEGLLLGGPDISEGIQIDAPRAVVQLQNIRAENIHARDSRNFSDNHPDVLQPWGGVRHLRVDRLTGQTDYQGVFLSGDRGPIGAVDLRNVNIVGTSTSRYLYWKSGSFPLRVDSAYAYAPNGRSLNRLVWGGVSTWSGVAHARPAGGDFVTREDAGLNYRSPGYTG